ncbi:sulfatase [Fulvivirgaceae bacterium BMA12]|uniref:Sulfatase n=1 Tax=Agaribacillus aureus TaxID=3051825 RepID=A0ABT8LLC4_9BACT|nr:sulfatase [Fulvivirgaceae bacterium BMA12]
MKVLLKGTSLLLLILAGTVMGCKSPENASNFPKRPNILFAIADDQSFPHAGAYGFAEIKTPAFDKVAKDGVLFNNAFVAAPQCSPSRAAILTGKNIWQLEEAGTHASSFPKKLNVFTDMLEDAGYQLGYTGKAWGPGNWKIAGWDRNPVGPAYNEKELTTVPSTGINKRDYFGNFSHFLEKRATGKPFFFWYGGHEPHRVYEPGSGAKAGKRFKNVQLPGFLPDDSVTRNDVIDYAFEIEYFDAHLLKMLKLLEEKGELANTVVVVTADNGMPFPYAKANLQEYGTHVPLAISWPDQIKSSKKVDDLVSMIDLAPTFLEIAGIKSAPVMTGQSIVPVLFSKGGENTSKRNYVLTGRERHTHARPDNLGYPARAIRTKEYLYVKNYKPERWPVGDPVPPNDENNKRAQTEGFKTLFPGYHDIDGSPSKTFMMKHQHEESVNRLFKNAFEKRPEAQLFDIQNDPECLYDLSGNTEYSDICADLRNKLDQELTKQGDPRMFGSDIFDSYPRYSPMRNFQGFNARGQYNPAYAD